MEPSFHMTSILREREKQTDTQTGRQIWGCMHSHTTETPQMNERDKAMRGYHLVTVCKPRIGPSRESLPLIIYFQPPELWKNKLT
jgi:hypothetical protein